MQRIHFTFFLIVLLMLGLGLVFAEHRDDEQAVDDIRQQFEDFYNEGDQEGVASYTQRMPSSMMVSAKFTKVGTPFKKPGRASLMLA
jgi:hypothetical protein